MFATCRVRARETTVHLRTRESHGKRSWANNYQWTSRVFLLRWHPARVQTTFQTLYNNNSWKETENIHLNLEWKWQYETKFQMTCVPLPFPPSHFSSHQYFTKQISLKQQSFVVKFLFTIRRVKRSCLICCSWSSLGVCEIKEFKTVEKRIHERDYYA